jgi:hypothetical protein
MKKAVGILVAVLGFAILQPAQAVESQTIAIIDTGIDSSKFGNVVYEACFTLNTCPNGQKLKDSKGWYSYSEGTGSALLNNFAIKGADHGFNMANIATIVNPNVKIIFIRISDEKVYSAFSMIRNDGGSIARALAWVAANSEKFNIKAVSISQSRSNFRAGTCPTDSLFETSVSSLKSNGVATFVATGNDRKKNQIGFPACVSGVYPVAAGTSTGLIVPSSNVDSNTKIIANSCALVSGSTCTKIPDYRGTMRAISGTSVSTVLAASVSVAKKSNESWDDFINNLPKAGNYQFITK